MKKVYFLLAAVVIAFAACNENSPSSSKKGSDVKAVVNENYVAKPFTVNAQGRKIVFSQGNLQYNLSGKAFVFAAHQYDIVGNANKALIDASVETDWIDFFGYGTGDAPTKISNENSDYAMFNDWGENKILNGGNAANVWRTINRDEFHYILCSRANCEKLRGFGNIQSFGGMILLPDNWVKPDGVDFLYDGYLNDQGQPQYTNFNTNSYTKESWKLMEAAGAVFFPAAGHISWEHLGYQHFYLGQVGENAAYWTSTPEGGTSAYRVAIDDYIYKDNYNYQDWSTLSYLSYIRYDERRYHFCVRLVKDAE